MRSSHLVLLASVTALATACSPVKVAEGLLLRDHFTRTTDVTYSTGVSGKLDVYRPRGAGKLAPVILFIYGGRWQGGTKNQFRLLGDALTKSGFVVVVPEYRSYPAVKFPGWVEDAAQAMKWTRANIHRFGGDSAQLWVVGHSSGGHTVTLLALDERYLSNVGLPANAAKGFVSLAGPVDTTWTDADVQILMGPSEGWPNSYPRTHIGGTEPPLLLLHGGDDKTVAAANSVGLAKLIRERGGCAQAVVYPGVGHVEIIVALSVPRLGIAPVLDNIVDFTRKPKPQNCGVR